MLGVSRQNFCQDIIAHTLGAGYRLVVVNAMNAPIGCQTTCSVVGAAISTFVLDVDSIESRRGSTRAVAGAKEWAAAFWEMEWNGMETRERFELRTRRTKKGSRVQVDLNNQTGVKVGQMGLLFRTQKALETQ
jgi:hypothetical protein